MREIVLGKTGIKVPQNAFGALPIQRVDMVMAVKLLRGAYEGGMRFFDTFTELLIRRVAGTNDEDRGVCRLWTLQNKMSIRAGYTKSSEKESSRL